MSQSQESLWADGRRDKQTISYMTLPAETWEYTKSCFKDNAKIFSKNSTTQENITILRLK